MNTIRKGVNSFIENFPAILVDAPGTYYSAVNSFFCARAVYSVHVLKARHVVRGRSE